MPLDVLEVALEEITHSGVDGAARRRVDAEELKVGLMLKVLQRDDPLRRSYLQRRWRGQPTSVSLSREVKGSNRNLCPISLNRR